MRCKEWWLAAALLVCMPVLAGEPPVKGTMPPSLLGKDRDGRVVDLGAMHGKVVIVTFWASWCGYCLKELPVLNALQTSVGGDWLRIIAVNVQDDNPAYRAMTRQMHDYKLTLTRDRSGRIAKDYGVNAYPNLWLIDRQGRVWGHHVGYGEDSLEMIVGEIQSLLRAEAETGQINAAG